MKKYLAPAIGILAFVIGGIIARANALEGLDHLEAFIAGIDLPKKKS